MISYLEWAANAVFVLSVVLAARNNINTWWTGIIGCGLFAVLFYQYNLYADVTLMIFFIFTSVYGWTYWGAKKELHAIQRTPVTAFINLVLLAALATVAYGWILHSSTDAYAPFIDSIILMFSVLAQFLLMQRRVETWVCWLIVDTVAVPLYASRELYLTSFVYGLFWCNAWFGLYTWIKLYKKEKSGADKWPTNPIAAD
ncbi:nicotinamide riboside transporter PnuC [Alkalimarinus alittae]|uniref:Nicotinamide riboside transporter PnuC n=1 Tax=Alkalimarinus alittae TaxID=2961619 RepID=A0ABY6MY80_9ALTE|nr:nicotinamide riboside transporter PnuC [Alkalimarinus alittae]UZE94796.1 nicotinamide riboside transporter PnuC [Alkalimarinus alittae]